MKKRVLIIDDDQQLNMINERVLKSSGLVNELHIVTDGNQALNYIVSRAERKYLLPDIIIVDLYMPVMSGFDFIDQFRALNLSDESRIQLVVFTSSSNPKDIQRARALGIKHYFNKPYLLRSLSGMICQSSVSVL
jgi:CheY-like chemotaxis protein